LVEEGGENIPFVVHIEAIDTDGPRFIEISLGRCKGFMLKEAEV